MPRIRPVKNLREYFMRSVAASMQRNDVEVDEHTSCYVVDLLTLYARSEALFEDGENGPELKPLALVLAEAAEGSFEQRNRALRRVGDQSLFIAGFLAESLSTRVVDVDYYVSMGGSAYAALSSSSRRTFRDLALGPVFAELAENFVDFVDVITDLRYRDSDEADILRLYETWTRTGSRRAARMLRSHGIEPQQDLKRRRKPH
jgi:hypothetical protein